jgi:hypothetical protein
MIAKKYTDNNDNPQLKVLATTGTRQWIGTEQALDEAIAAGKIQPGTVADTYMEVDEPEVDYATVEYVNKNNKLAGWETFMPEESKLFSFTNVQPNERMWDKPAGWLVPYDGYIATTWNGWATGGIAFAYVQVSSDGGNSWQNLYSMGSDQSTQNSIVFPVSKGDLFRRGIINGTSVLTKYDSTGSISCNFYKERAYV